MVEFNTKTNTIIIKDFNNFNLSEIDNIILKAEELGMQEENLSFKFIV